MIRGSLKSDTYLWGVLWVKGERCACHFLFIQVLRLRQWILFLSLRTICIISLS